MNAFRKRRLLAIGFILTCCIAAGYLILQALEDNIHFFISPTELTESQNKQGMRVRLGGVVEKDSVKHGTHLQVQFQVTDFVQSVGVLYVGVLPDLFREGQGVVALGKWNGNIFVADQVLAKHDENYKPPEVRNALESASNHDS